MNRPEEARGSSPLVWLICAVVFAETTLLTLVTPLIPRYAADFGMSHAEAGVFVALYAAGSIAGSVPAGMLVARLGARTTVLLSLALVAAGSLGMAYGRHLALLDATRFLQGIAGTLAWSGSFSWLAEVAPAGHRARMLSRGLAAASLGGVLGPVVGGVAELTSLSLVFTVLAGLFGILAIGIGLRPASGRGAPTRLRELLSAVGRPDIAVPGWLVAAAGAAFGTIAVTGPLKLADLGASGPAVSATFLCAAFGEVLVTRLAGTASDRYGHLRPIRAGLVLAAVFAVLLAVPAPVFPAALGIVALVAALSLFLAPGFALVSAGARRIGLQQGLAFGLTNISWAAGNLLGALAGGALAGVGAAVPGTAVAALLLLSLGFVRRR
ncbi:MFS transporter [Amycolatopsis sp. FU40]|uniref:MFS transporter n=1 Tax=Amycolatopsis sp. FU40 TaxID=2914159 RepID=UPI001F009259|nr:MFS transporter [Amycolatopsis sp. FU40]UKD57698.1 MFS transporter [Amycolatopsis sp. FU40]